MRLQKGSRCTLRVPEWVFSHIRNYQRWHFVSNFYNVCMSLICDRWIPTGLQRHVCVFLLAISWPIIMFENSKHVVHAFEGHTKTQH